AELFAILGRHHLAMNFNVVLQLALQPPPVQQIIYPTQEVAHEVPPGIAYQIRLSKMLIQALWPSMLHRGDTFPRQFGELLFLVRSQTGIALSKSQLSFRRGNRRLCLSGSGKGVT